jgi:hypothetical protein
MRHRWLSLALLRDHGRFFARLAAGRVANHLLRLLPANHPFVQTYQDHPIRQALTITIMVRRKDGDIYVETLAKSGT